MGLPAIFMNHDPVANTKGMLNMHRQADKHIKNYITQGNPDYDTDHSGCRPDPGDGLIKNRR